MYTPLPFRTCFDDSDIYEITSSSSYILKTSKNLRCKVCHEKVYPTTTREVLENEVEKIDNIYYILCIEGTCRELFQLTPQEYLLNEGTEQYV